MHTKIILRRCFILMLLFGGGVAQAAPPSQAVSLRVLDGRRAMAPLADAARVDVSYEDAVRDGLLVRKLTLTNRGDEPAWLHIILDVDAPGDTTRFWDGRELHRGADIAHVRDTFVNTFPLACAYGPQRGVAVGIAPDEYVSYLEHGYDPATHKLHAATRLVIAPGASDTIDLLALNFKPRYGHHDALQLVFDAYAHVVNIDPHVDQRLRAGYAGGMVQTHIRDKHMPPTFSVQEQARRSHATWDWYFRPAEYNGFVFDRAEYWGEEKQFEHGRGPWGTDVPGWQGGTAREHHIAAHQWRMRRAMRGGVAPMYYMLAHGDAELVERLCPDSAHYRDEDVFDGFRRAAAWGAKRGRKSLRLFPWGNGWSEILRRDLTDVFKTYDARGIAWDSNRIHALYREPNAVKQCPHPAFDDNGPYVHDSVGYAMLMDWVHTQRLPDGTKAGVASNLGPPRQSYLLSLRADATIAEMNYVRVVGQLEEFEHDRIMRGRRPKTQLSGLWRDPLGNFFNFSEMTTQEIRDTVRGLHRQFMLMCLYLGIYPEPDSTLGYEFAMQLRPAIDAAIHAGWQPVCAMRGSDQLWLSRYGIEGSTVLTIGHPMDHDATSISDVVEVDNAYLGRGGFILGDFFDQPVSMRVTPTTTAVALASEPGDAHVWQAVGAVDAAMPIDVMAQTERQVDRLTYRWRISADQAGALKLRIFIPPKMRLETIRQDGRELVYEVEDGVGKCTIDLADTSEVTIDFVSKVFVGLEQPLAEFPFLTGDGGPGCQIVTPDKPTMAQRVAAERVQEYFRFYVASLAPWAPTQPAPQVTRLPIVAASQADQTSAQVRIGFDGEGRGLRLADGKLRINRIDARDEAEVVMDLLRALDAHYTYVGRIQSHLAKAMQHGVRGDGLTWSQFYASRKHPATRMMLEKGDVIFNALPVVDAQAVTHDGCLFRQSRYDGELSLVLQNEHIRAEIVPTFSGRVVSLSDTASGRNQLMPYRAKAHLKLTDQTDLIQGNMGGYNEWMAGYGGVRTTEFNYDWRMVERTMDRVAVELTFRCDRYSVRRIVELRRGERTVGFDVQVAVQPGEKDLRYWAHMTVAPGGDVDDANDRVFLPSAGPVQGRQQAGHTDATHDKDTEVEEGAIKLGVAYAGTLAQPWRAVIDTTVREGLGQVLQADQIKGKGKGYFWRGGELLTMEMLYPPLDKTAESRGNYRIDWAVLAGLPRIDYLDRDMALAMASPRRITSSAVELQLLPLRDLRGRTLVLAAQRGEAEPVELARVSLDQANATKPTQYALAIDAQRLGACEHQLMIGLDGATPQQVIGYVLAMATDATEGDNAYMPGRAGCDDGLPDADTTLPRWRRASYAAPAEATLHDGFVRIATGSDESPHKGTLTYRLDFPEPATTMTLDFSARATQQRGTHKAGGLALGDKNAVTTVSLAPDHAAIGGSSAKAPLAADRFNQFRLTYEVDGGQPTLRLYVNGDPNPALINTRFTGSIAYLRFGDFSSSEVMNGVTEWKHIAWRPGVVDPPQPAGDAKMLFDADSAEVLPSLINDDGTIAWRKTEAGRALTVKARPATRYAALLFALPESTTKDKPRYAIVKLRAAEPMDVSRFSVTTRTTNGDKVGWAPQVRVLRQISTLTSDQWRTLVFDLDTWPHGPRSIFRLYHNLVGQDTETTATAFDIASIVLVR